MTDLLKNKWIFSLLLLAVAIGGFIIVAQPKVDVDVCQGSECKNLPSQQP